jgi:hypothetical protein
MVIKSMQAIKARAYRRGKTQVDCNDLDILENMFWQKQEDIPLVKESVAKFAFPLKNDLQKIEDIAQEMFDLKIKPHLESLQETAIDGKRKIQITQDVILTTELIASQQKILDSFELKFPNNPMIATSRNFLSNIFEQCDDLQRSVIRRR